MGKQIKCRAKLYKRVIAILLVLIVLFSLSASQSYAAPTFLAENPLYPQNQRNHVYTSQNHFGGNIYSSLAFDFHIFATEVELGAHTNGNIATNILKANGHAFGADEQNHLHKREDNYIRTYASGISNIASNGNTIVGSQISLEVNKQDKRIKIGHSQNYLNQETSKKILQESKTSDPYINIEGELAYLSTLSSQLTKKETSKDVTIQSGSEITHTITVTDQGGNHYLNIQAGTFFKTGQKNILNISLPQKTTLIINVDMNFPSTVPVSHAIRLPLQRESTASPPVPDYIIPFSAWQHSLLFLIKS